MKQTLLLMVLALGMCSISGSAQSTRTSNPATSSITKERMVGEDGYIWYLLKEGNLYGAQDIEGREIIPVKYTGVTYETGLIRYFRVIDGDFRGVYTRKGTLVVSTDRHYTSVWSGIYGMEFVGMVCWMVKKNDGGYGMLDARGNEVISGERYSNVNLKHDMRTGGAPYYFSVSQGEKRYGICGLDGNELLPPLYESCWITDGIIQYMVNGVCTNGINNYSDNTRFDYRTFDDLYNYSFSSNSPSSSSTSSSSSSSNNESGGGTTTVVVEHHRDPVPVQEWQQCPACYGSGRCSYVKCGGSGWYYIGDRASTCSMCHGSGKCSTCAGKGGHYITVYR